MHTIKNKLSRHTWLEFNDWLKEEAEVHERMEVTYAKPETDAIPHATPKTKTASKVFAKTSKADALTVGQRILPTKPVSCTDCK